MVAERTILLRVAYDGTRYSGWQIQPRDPTIQGSLQAAVSCLHGAPTKVFGASRTDAGVHARGQVASFRASSTIPLDGYLKGLNTLLPEDIAVVETREMGAAFHARHSARGKHYRYQIWNAPARQPQVTRYAWHRMQHLDEVAMAEAAALLVGRHDFGAFRAADCDREHAERTLWRAEVTRHPNLIWIDVEGTAFLKHMVRTLVGTLVEVGRGKRPTSWMAEVLASRDRRRAGLTAPPQGLCLERVYYPELGDAERS
ncbi:MAG: tRNA pseudouridine(38-40) synthase TruA [bacterium]